MLWLGNGSGQMEAQAINDGDILKDMRKRAGLTRREAAQLLSIPQRHYNIFENSQTIHSETLKKFINIFTENRLILTPELFKEIRKEFHIKVRDFGNRLGIHRFVWLRWEKGSVPEYALAILILRRIVWDAIQARSLPHQRLNVLAYMLGVKPDEPRP